jgi:hypothetical protein
MAGNVLLWSNVGVDIETARSNAQTIDAISKASPAVVSYQGADPANGDYIVLSVTGMYQVDGKVFRVANVNTAANTLQLEGEDSTLYDTFLSGSFAIVTFGVSMTTATDVNASGGDPEYDDTTTIHTNVKSRVPTVSSPMSVEMNSLFSATDPALAELRKATKTLTKRAIRFRFASGPKMVGEAYVSAAGVPTGSAQQKVTTKVAFEFQGLPTVYGT